MTVIAALAIGAHALPLAAPAIAQREDPSPEQLWDAYPLDPENGQQSEGAPSIATPAPTATPQPAAGDDGLPIPALAAGVALAFALGLAAGQAVRRRRAALASVAPEPTPPPPPPPDPAAPEPDVDRIAAAFGRRSEPFVRPKRDRAIPEPEPPPPGPDLESLVAALEDAPRRSPDPGPEPAPATATNHEPVSRANRKRPTERKANPAPTAEPHRRPQRVANPQPVARAGPPPTPTATGEPQADPIATAEPASTPTAKREPEPTPTANAEPQPKPSPATEPQPESVATGEPKPEPTAEPEPVPAPRAEPEPKPIADAEPVGEVGAGPAAGGPERLPPTGRAGRRAPAAFAAAAPERPAEAPRRRPAAARQSAEDAAVAAQRFARPEPWPEAETEWTCEIGWKAGYRKSVFRAMAAPPGPGRRRSLGESAPILWTFMADPMPPTPELIAAVKELVAALEAAGWERTRPAGPWYALRFLWRGQGEPQRIEIQGRESANA